MTDDYPFKASDISVWFSVKLHWNSTECEKRYANKNYSFNSSYITYIDICLNWLDLIWGKTFFFFFNQVQHCQTDNHKLTPLIEHYYYVKLRQTEEINIYIKKSFILPSSSDLSFFF